MSLLCDREETSEVKGFGVGGGGIQDGNGEQSGALGAPILTPWLVFFWCPWPFS